MKEVKEMMKRRKRRKELLSCTRLLETGKPAVFGENEQSLDETTD